MENRSPGSTGRPRGADAAIPELQGADGLALARWVAGATSGGISQRSAAQLAGISRRHAQRLMDRYASDPYVSRDRLIGQALRWEGQAGEALQEAVSHSLAWLREASANPETDARSMAAALGATVASAHRLGEIGARRAKRLQPEAPQQQAAFSAQQLLEAVAAGCEQIRRQLPPEQHGQAFEQLHRQLRSGDQPGQADPIDVAAVAVLPEAEASEPPACPL